MRFLALVALYVALASYAITDVLNRGQRDIYGLQRGMWIAIIVLAPYIGALVWIGLKMRGDGRRHSQAYRAPDDDPDYLRWLREQERRRRES